LKFYVQHLSGSLSGEEVELCSGEHILGRSNKALSITSNYVSRKQAILQIDDKTATIQANSETTTLISRNSSEKEDLIFVTGVESIPLQENDIIILARGFCELKFFSKLVEEEELNTIALEDQQDAAFDDLADSCKSLLEQEKSILLTQELLKLSEVLPVSIRGTHIFQLLAGMKKQVTPEEIPEARQQYKDLYESFLRFRKEYDHSKIKIRSSLEEALPDQQEEMESERFGFLQPGVL